MTGVNVVDDPTANNPVPVVLANVKGKPVKATVGLPDIPDPLLTDNPALPD